MSSGALFAGPGFAVRELRADEVPALQALFEANPGYFEHVGGQPPRPHEAQDEFDEYPPAHLGFTRRWFAGVYDEAERLTGLVVLLSDLSAPGVWHIALFFLDGAVRGTGLAARLHAALEAFARQRGASWLRLGVVAGNARAERFWARCGYAAVRHREIVNASGEPRTTQVMVKPLAAGTRADYLRLVPRDEPGSTLP